MPSVLITGASRGIGLAAALHMKAAGWEVIGSVRNANDGEALSAQGIAPVTLDVGEDASVAELSAQLPATLDAVVNNAGIVVNGPVEAVSPAQLRQQLEVNVVGQAAVTQAVLPRLRASKGRVVFVSSVSGRVATPMTGAYNASKFALEAMADALRMEVAPWGVKVVLVEPMQTDTDLWRKAQSDFDATVAELKPEYRELYAGHIEGYRKSIPRSQKLAVPAEDVAASIEQALTARRPKARYVPSRSGRLQAVLGELTPTPLLDRALRAGTGVPRKRA